MPRQARKIEVGEIYHVFNRGVEKRDIFLKPQDYERFIISLEFFNDEDSIWLWDTLFKPENNNSKVGPVPTLRLRERLEEQRNKKKKSIVEVLAFCLMPNHFHLILREIRHGGIKEFMHKIGGYATYFNKQYQRVGPLFQGRYKTVRIGKEVQLDVIFSYVHTNPVELWEPNWRKEGVRDVDAALAKLKEYRWSSLLDYLGQNNFPYVTNRDFFLDYFGGKDGCLSEIESWLNYKGKESPFFAE